MIVIKEFSADMQEAAVRFLTEVFPESGKSFELGGRHSAYADIKQNFMGFWCLLDDNRIIGTAAVKKLGDKVCELKCMYLYREYQGQGLGRRLAETAMSFAREKGFEKMVLDTVSTYEKALRLYENLGFRPIERYNDNEKADVFMMKELDAGTVVREITDKDFEGLMRLYMELHDNLFPEKDDRVMSIWERIVSDKDHHIIVAEVDGRIAASCVCVIIPNLTRGQRPYAFIENVVTSAKYRRNGLATACLDYARELARKENCYKMMLMTGSKDSGVLDFYEKAGYNSSDKTAFIQWL